MRASIDNIYLAKAVGINVEAVFAIAWFLIGAVTGLAGVYMVFGIVVILVLMFMPQGVVAERPVKTLKRRRLEELRREAA